MQKRGRLQEIINQLKEIPAEIKRNEKKVDSLRKTDKAAFATSLVGLSVAIAALPFTGGLSLAVFGAGAATSVAGSTTRIGVMTTMQKDRRKIESKLQSLAAEFRTIINSLKEKLKNVERSSEELRAKETNTYKRLKWLFLELQIPIMILRENTSLVSDSDVTGEFEETLKKLDGFISCLNIIM